MKAPIEIGIAFNNNYRLIRKNCRVESDGCVTTMKLFGHTIAAKVGDELSINMRSYNTMSTRRYLNVINGVNIRVKKGVTYLNGVEWDGGEWIMRYNPLYTLLSSQDEPIAPSPKSITKLKVTKL